MRQADWQTADGAVRLYLGDCLELLPQMEAGSVDAVVTDPPYGINLADNSWREPRKDYLRKGSYEGYEDTVENLRLIVVPAVRVALSLAGGIGLVFCAAGKVCEFPEPTTLGGVYVPGACGRTAWGFSNLAVCLLYGTSPHTSRGCRHTVLVSSDHAQKNGHPCPKPLEWMTWSVGIASLAGYVVLDPFMGSGTTGVACIRTGRHFIGIEKEPKYFDIAVKRIEAELKRTALFEPPPKILRQASLLDNPTEAAS